MAKSHLHAGKFNLRGKKYKLLRCRCCCVQDFRDKIEADRVAKEIRTVSSVGRAGDS